MLFIQFIRFRLERLMPMVFLGSVMGLIIWLAQIYIKHNWGIFIPVVKSFFLNSLLVPSNLLLDESHGFAWPINMPMWSLFFEVLASVVFALLIYKLSDGALLASAVLAGASIIFTVSIGGTFGGGIHWNDLSLGFLRVTYPFLVGVLIYRFVQPRLSKQDMVMRQRIPWQIPAFLLAIVCVWPFGSSYNDFWQVFVALFIMPTVVLCGIYSIYVSFARCVMEKLGMLSFPLYLSHYPIVIASSFAIRRFAAIEEEKYYILLIPEVVVILVVACWMVPIEARFRKWITGSIIR